jgi:hypothetical protein
MFTKEELLERLRKDGAEKVAKEIAEQIKEIDKKIKENEAEVKKLQEKLKK